MHLVVYGDFNCPYSCLASTRADALLEAGIAEIEWRAVEHDPALPTPSRPATGELAEMFGRELAAVAGLLRPHERFPVARPPVQANTRAAIDAFAATSGEEAHELRRRLFGALWFEGRDIGDPAVLAELTRPDAGDVHIDAERAARWQETWMAFDRRLVPMLVLPDGVVSRGLGALARLAELAD